MNTRVTRRGFLGAAAAVGVAGCAPYAPGLNEPSSLEGFLDWEGAWERLVTEGRGEGSLAVLTLPGPEIQAVFQAFEAAFPGIVCDLRAHGSASMAAPRVLQERGAEIYSYDVAVFGIQNLFAALKDRDAFDPIRPAIFRPDVVNDTAWRGGFEAGFVDTERRWVYNHLADQTTHFWVNGELVKDGEIKSIWDLIDPRWKGRFLFADVRNTNMCAWMAAVRDSFVSGEHLLKRILVDQEPVFIRDVRLLTEQMTAGGYAVAASLSRSFLQELQGQGRGRAIKELALTDVRTVSTSGGGLWLFNRAPHPHAARLFINWALTKPGQRALSTGARENSRRADVEPYDPQRLPDPGKTYFLAMEEENVRKQTEARAYARRLVG